MTLLLTLRSKRRVARCLPSSSPVHPGAARLALEPAAARSTAVPVGAPLHGRGHNAAPRPALPVGTRSRPVEAEPAPTVTCPRCGAKDHFLLNVANEAALRVLEDSADTVLLAETLAEGPAELICERCEAVFQEKGSRPGPN